MTAINLKEVETAFAGYRGLGREMIDAMLVECTKARLDRLELQELRDDRTCLRAALLGAQCWMKSRPGEPMDERTEKLLAAIEQVLSETDSAR